MAHATHRCSATMRQYSSQYASTSQSPTAALASPGRCWQPQRPSLRPSTRRAITIASVVTTDRQSTASKSTGRIVLESEEELRSTPTHRAIVYGCSGLLAALALHGLADIHTPADGVATALGVVAAYLLAGTRVDNRVQQLSHHACTDLGTGIYHWSVDNYGDGNTPIVGDQIAAFQGHHQRPWTITEREFCNNVHKVFKPALPFAALFLAASPLMPAPLEVSLALFIWLACMSQQFHAWSHMKASELHPAVLALQVCDAWQHQGCRSFFHTRLRRTRAC